MSHTTETLGRQAPRTGGQWTWYVGGIVTTKEADSQKVGVRGRVSKARSAGRERAGPGCSRLWQGWHGREGPGSPEPECARGRASHLTCPFPGILTLVWCQRLLCHHTDEATKAQGPTNSRVQTQSQEFPHSPCSPTPWGCLDGVPGRGQLCTHLPTP